MLKNYFGWKLYSAWPLEGTNSQRYRPLFASSLSPADIRRYEDGKYIPAYRLNWTCFALHNLEIQKTNFLV